MKRHNSHFPKVLSSLVLSGSLLWLGALSVAASGSSVQDLIDAAAPGSTLTLPPGTNYGPVEIKKDLTLQGAGAEQTVLHGSNTTRVLIIGPNVTVTVNDLKITGGYVDHHDPEGGVGVLNAGDLTMNRCSIEQNTTSEPRRGGGLSNQAEASLIMTDCLVKANWAGGPGGGILNSGTLTMDRCRIEGNGSGIWGSGGGIASTGPLTLKDCAIRNNWVDDGSGGGIYAGASATILNNCTVSGNKSAYSHLSGGGIYGGHPLILNNCTISGNRTGDGVGGGIAGEAIHLNHCTITRNIGSAGIDESGGGGIYGTVLECRNTIIAGNSTSAGGSGAPDCKGTIHSLGYNLIGDSSGCVITPAVGDQIGTASAPLDPKLLFLNDNGGPTQTHEPMLDSPVLDQGSQGGLATDQRGVDRPIDLPSIPNASDGSDIGAYELYQVYSPIQALINQAAPGSTVTLPPGTNYGPVEIYRDLTLQGAGLDLTFLHGSQSNRVVLVGAGVTVTLNDLTITEGHDYWTLRYRGGSGLYNLGDLTMNRCRVEKCRDLIEGAGIVNSTNASLTMNDCQVLENSVFGNGGGVLNCDNATLTMNDCLVARNESHYGGGVYNGKGNLTMNRCLIEQNGGDHAAGGGIFSPNGDLVLNHCTIRRNTTGDGSGGGIFAGVERHATLNHCTINNNWAGDGSGGGLVGGSLMVLSNCTISGNKAGGGTGGGIQANNVRLYHCTITGNTGTVANGNRGGGGIFGSVAECRNTIIAGNSAYDDGNDCKGTIHSLGYNLIGNGSGCVITPAAGDQIGTASDPIDPRLGPLQDNGGPTQTHLLLAGSPALDQGSSGGLTRDQRGLARPHDFAALPNARDGSDIGAVEMQAAELPVNLPPSISSIQDQVLLANHTSDPIAFTVGDKETPAGQLTVSAQTRAIYALENSSVEVRLGGSGADRTVTLAAQEGIGLFAVTLTVNDGQGASAASSFFVTVRSPGQAVFSSPSPVNIPDHGSASPYPSTLTVQNMDGVVDKATVILHELSHTYPRDLGLLLVSPDGKAVLLMAAAGGGYDLNNVTLEFDEAAAGLLPQNAQIVSGTYQPSGYNRYFPFTAPAPSTRPYSTALSGLRGSEPNGTWSLYVLDSAAYDQGALRKGWTLHLKTQTGAPPSISPIADQVTAVNTSPPLLLFTVSDPDTPLSELTVSAASEDQALVPDSVLLVGGRGAQRTLLLLTAANKTGSVRLRLQASDGAHTVTQSFQLTISGSPGSSLSGWNTESISIPDHGPAAPYPSSLSMVNLEGVIYKAAVTLHGLSHTWPADVRALLVGPFGQKVLLMANAGYRHPLDQVTLQLEDSAGQSLPASAQITSGLYQPTSLSAGGSLPPPAPAGPYATTLSALNRTLPNGLWSLYVWDDSAYDQGSLIQGWGLTLFTRQEGAPLISAIPDQTTVRNTATAPLLFTVSDAEVAPDQLTVTAQSGNQDLVPNANLILGGRGANRTLVIIPAPNQTGLGTITLYASNGKTTVARSFTLHINPASPDSRSFLNPGAIAIRDHTTASPYPSTIEVSGLAGAVGRVTVTLLGLSHTWPEDISLILAGPAGQKCWLMGHAGRNQRLDHIALQFSDAAASGLPQLGPIVSGTFKPTSFTTRSLPAPAPAGPYAASLAVFQGQAPNGAWSLYLTDDQALDQGQIAQGWILTLVSAPAGAPQAVAAAAALRSGGAAPFWLEVVGRRPDGTVQLRLHGQAGERYLIQASSDQAHWEDLQGGVRTGDSLDLKEGLPATHRFYRAKLETKSKPK